MGFLAPSIRHGLQALLDCNHNLLLAHAEVVKQARAKYRASKPGWRYSMVLDPMCAQPLDQSKQSEAGE